MDFAELRCEECSFEWVVAGNPQQSDKKTISATNLRLLGQDATRDQSEPTNQQHEHHHGFEKTRRLKKDMHVGNHSAEYEERPRDREQPSDDASAAPEQNPDPKQHGHQRNAKSVCAVEAPVRAHDLYLIADQVSAYTSHEKTKQEVAEPSRRTTHIAKGTVFHAIEDIRP